MNLPSDSELSSLARAGQELFDAEKKVLDLEAQLKVAKKVRDAIAHVTVPELLGEIGIEQITMTGGREVSVKEYLSVSPLKDNRPLVLAALVEQGAGALIKSTVSVSFGRDSAEEVKRVNEMLQREGLTTKIDIKVEPATLKKHVKERLAKGEFVDQELFGVRTGAVAKFSKGAPKAQPFGDE